MNRNPNSYTFHLTECDPVAGDVLVRLVTSAGEDSGEKGTQGEHGREQKEQGQGTVKALARTTSASSRHGVLSGPARSEAII